MTVTMAFRVLSLLLIGFAYCSVQPAPPVSGRHVVEVDVYDVRAKLSESYVVGFAQAADGSKGHASIYLTKGNNVENVVKIPGTMLNFNGNW